MRRSLGTFSGTGGGAEKAEYTFVEGKGAAGWSAKVKGGLEYGGTGKTKPRQYGDPATERGMKTELYVSGQVGFGSTSAEVKVTPLGIERTKSVGDMAATGTGAFKVLGLKVSVIPASVPMLEVPLD